MTTLGDTKFAGASECIKLKYANNCSTVSLIIKILVFVFGPADFEPGWFIGDERVCQLNRY